MAKPVVAIVGRPNVGKSTFFNKMAGGRVSIVDNMPGVTRDRIYADVEWCGYSFTLIDTGGIELRSEDFMWRHIRRQAELAVEVADVILFFTDGKQGITPDDYDVADFLRKTRKPVVLAVNKMDNPDDSAKFDFYQLNLGEPIAVSSEHSLGLGDLLDEVVKYFVERSGLSGTEEAIKIAVVGKPNSGKSSLVNKLLGFERVIVTDFAGTTRDAVDTPFEFDGKKYILIDTAGIRKKSKVDEDVEYYSVIRAIGAIKRADVVLVVIDSLEMISEQDVRILGMVHGEGKPSVVVMNKWDKIEKDSSTINAFNAKLREELKFMDYFKAVYISALTGQRVNTVLGEADKAYANSSREIATGLLNDVIGDAVIVNPPPLRVGKRLKISFARQVASNPPTFLLFVNEPTLVHFSYLRYLENELRKAFDFSGTPIKIITRRKDGKDS